MKWNGMKWNGKFDSSRILFLMRRGVLILIADTGSFVVLGTCCYCKTGWNWKFWQELNIANLSTPNLNCKVWNTENATSLQ